VNPLLPASGAPLRPMATVTKITALALRAYSGLAVAGGVIALGRQALEGDGDPAKYERVIDQLGALSSVVSLTTAVVFLVWMRWARGNAEALLNYPHRWGQNWIFFGWVVPIVSLWIPRRIMLDLRLASDPAEPSRLTALPVPLINWWWGFFLAMGFAEVMPVVFRSGSAGEAVSLGVAAVVTVIAAELAVRVVSEIAALQDSPAPRIAEDVPLG
jgi:hypothetical protein